jgi:hypothetical protein
VAFFMEGNISLLCDFEFLIFENPSSHGVFLR